MAMGLAEWSPCLVACFHILSALWVTYQQSGIPHAMVNWKCNGLLGRESLSSSTIISSQSSLILLSTLGLQFAGLV